MKTKTIRKIPYDLGIQSPSSRNYAYVSVISERLEERLSITVHAPTEAELIGKLASEYDLYPCPVKDTIFRTAAECDRIRKEQASPADKTEYARAIGYTGTKPVIVQDGKVISHRFKDWFDFCGILHDAARHRKTTA